MSAELATALAYVLQKWKDTGADPAETAPFDELLARVPSEPEPPVKIGREGVARRSSITPDKLAILDAEIEAVNREAD